MIVGHFVFEGSERALLSSKWSGQLNVDGGRT